MLFTQGSGAGSEPKSKREAPEQGLANSLKRESDITNPRSVYVGMKGTERAQVWK